MEMKNMKESEEQHAERLLGRPLLLSDHAQEHHNSIWDKSHGICTAEDEKAFNEKHKRQVFRTKGTFEVSMRTNKHGIASRVEDRTHNITTRKPDKFWWLHW